MEVPSPSHIFPRRGSLKLERPTAWWKARNPERACWTGRWPVPARHASPESSRQRHGLLAFSQPACRGSPVW